MSTDYDNLKDHLTDGARELGVELTGKEVGQFFLYMEELIKWNKKISLTTVTEPAEIIDRHFLDSLAAYRYVKDAGNLLDLGAGGGLPGIALKIVLPSMGLTLVDSVTKKVNFLKHIIRTLALENSHALAQRAESEELLSELGGSFDVVISRAFTSLREFFDFARPYLAPGGTAVAIKSTGIGSELDLAEGAGYETEVERIKLPFGERKISIVLWRAP